MAGQSLEFTINARDQASKVVQSVKNKVENFGKDVGKSIVGIVGPMALVGLAVSKVTDYLAEMEKKAKEAFNWGTSIADAADKMGVTAVQFQQISNAADVTGSSVEDVGKAFKLSSKLIDDARNGNERAIAILAEFGISVKDLADTKPEDVLAKLAGAMSAASDPTQKMAIAMTVLGDSAKELQKTLEKGFDIKGAMENLGILTEEEARTLQAFNKIEQAKARAEKLKLAREGLREAFLDSPEGREFADEERRKQRRERSFGINPFKGQVETVSTAKIDAEIDRKAKKAAAEKLANETIRELDARAANKSAITGILDIKGKDDEAKKKPEKEKAETTVKGAKMGTQSDAELGSISVKSAPIMVSSLREIGGGMAGEKIASQIDLQTIQVDLTRSMLTELQSLNNKSRDTVDFTKLPIQGGVSNFTKNLA
jgi:hypothetical protein